MTGRLPLSSNPYGGGALACCASNMAVTIHYIPPPIKRSAAGCSGCYPRETLHSPADVLAASVEYRADGTPVPLHIRGA